MNWLLWTVPIHRKRHYLLMLWLVLFFLPILFNIRYSMFGYLVNLLWADFILYHFYATQDKINNKDNDENNTL
jgi:predicted membrane protein